jgi:isopenicillin N synthase-like dioxygenase
MSLHLDKNYFRNDICKEPLGLFRIFHYPKDDKGQDLWGVGEHTDYGLITLLTNTDKGLEVKNRSNEWVKADPI